MNQKSKICLKYSHTWFHHPLTIQTKLDKKILHIDVSGKENVTVRKTVDVAKGSHCLSLIISGKDDTNNCINEVGDLIQNTLVQIKSLEIDDVNLTHMILNGGSVFRSKDNPIKTLQNTLTFGYNGVWSMEFEVPFYDWLLCKLLYQ